MDKKTKSLRLNLRISKIEQTRLGKLMDATNAASAVEVIRRALLAYEYLLSAKENKSQIIIRDKNGKETRLVII